MREGVGVSGERDEKGEEERSGRKGGVDVEGEEEGGRSGCRR